MDVSRSWYLQGYVALLYACGNALSDYQVLQDYSVQHNRVWGGGGGGGGLPSLPYTLVLSNFR